MNFIRKLMDVLTLDSTRQMKGRVVEPIYHDRYFEESHDVYDYREITFNGRNFDIPEVKLCAVILIDGSIKGSAIRSNDRYALYFEGRYGIVNISTLHRWLYEQGYLRGANLTEALSLYKVTELKMILESLGLKKTGRKNNLISRIVNVIDDNDKARIVSQSKRLFVTEKGYHFLEENGDYYMWHRKSYGVTFEEFNRHRILQGKKRQFHDTIFQALSEKAYTYQIKGYFSKLEMIYFWLAESLYDEGRYDLAISYYLYKLYFSTNLASHPFWFDVENVRIDGTRAIKRRIKDNNDIFKGSSMDRLVELKEYYREQLLDVVYGLHILPYCIFDKVDMADVIHDLYEGTFDEKIYTNYICKQYEKYIRKYL